MTLTANGHGPFAMSGPDERLLLAQTFVAVACTTAMLLAVIASSGGRPERTLQGIASTLQEGLLQPRLPHLPQLEIATYFRPVGAAQQVGGDFYDLFQAGDGSWALAVGDVRGKGPAAAAMTALARYTLAGRRPARHAAERRPRAAERGHALAARGRGLLQRRVRQPRPARRLRAASLASGGHPLPLVLRADGRVEQLGEPGLLLGIDASPALFDHRADLAAGDTLLMYTDGLLDAYAPGPLRAQPSSSRRSCGRVPGGPPPRSLAALEERLLRDPPGEPRDDIAVVALRIAARSRRRRPARHAAFAGSVRVATKEGCMSDNLATILTDTQPQHGDRTAMKLDDVELSYSMLDGASAHVAGLLRHRGLEPGDRVGVMLPNVPYFPVVYYGILRAGGSWFR